MLTALILALAATGQTRDYNLLAYQAPAAAHPTPRVDTASRPPKMIDGERQPTMSYDPGPVVRTVVEPPPDETPLALDPTVQVPPTPSTQAPVASFQSAPTVSAAPATACYSSSYAGAPATSCYSSAYAGTPAAASYVAAPPVVTYVGAAPFDSGSGGATYGQAMPAYSTGVTDYRGVARRGLFGGFRQKFRMTSSGAGMTCTAAGCY
jgi:hypothetical protein